MRLRSVAACTVASALVLAGCGSTEDNDAAGGDQPEASPGGSSEEVALRWRTRPDNQAEIDLYQQISDNLDGDNDAFTLEYEPGGSETSSYQDVLKTEIGAGTAPDVFWIPGTDVADFAKRGLILDLAEQADAAGVNTEDFYEGPMGHLTTDPETGQPADKLWGLPRDVSTFALYLNLDLISEAGVEDPRVLAEEGTWDWAAFQATADAITKTGGANKGFGVNSWWANYGYFMNSAGGGFFNEDRTACALDTPESIEGLTYLKGLYDAGLGVPFGEDAEPPFLAGTVGMFMNGRWATPGTRASAEFNWDVVKLPEGPAGARNWQFWGAYVVNAKTEHPEQAFALVEDLTSVETQSAISELGANIPSRQGEEALEAFLEFTPPENNQAFVDGITEDPATEGPLWKGDWPAFSTKADAAVNAVITGQRTIEDFQSNICTETAGDFEG
jgi:multiple sugar transport system substrate-binding protein